MQHKFICIKRYHKRGIEGDFNIRFGTELLTDDKFIYYNGDCNTGKTVCAIESQDSYDYFAINDDGNGNERGRLTSSIVKILSNRDNNYQKRWDKIWDDSISNTMRREDYTDRWLWSTKFYQASIDDLNHVMNLIKEV